MDEVLVKNRVADGTIYQNRFVKEGTTGDGYALQAAASSDLIIGVSALPTNTTTPNYALVGVRLDIQHVGIADLLIGGAVTRGQLLTSDADGKGVAVSAAGQRVGAMALQSGVTGDIIKVLVQPGVAGNNAYEIATATIVVGAENTNVVAVTIQLKDAAGVDLAVRGTVFAFLSDDATGDSVIATAHSGGWAIGTDGVLLPVVTNKSAFLRSEADGDIDLAITETGAKNAYLVVVLPNGTSVVSAVIAHAA